MTTLTKPIKREVAVSRFTKPIVVTLDPETQRIGFHEKGARRIYWLPIATAYAMAIRADKEE